MAQGKYGKPRYRAGSDLYDDGVISSDNMAPPKASRNNVGNSMPNMAYIGVTQDGSQPVGPMGIKKAEKDLIMRRYKYNH